MHSAIVILALVGSVLSDAPYSARLEKPHVEYGVPEIVAPYPARVEKPHVEYGVPFEVYSAPEVRVQPVKLVKTEYNYNTFTPKKIVEIPATYPARVEIPHIEYGVPEVVVPYPARVEKPHVEYGVPQEVYEVPEIRVEPVLIKSEYNYETYTPQKKIEVAPYPNRIEKPHLEYGVPEVVAPYSGRVVKPHLEYGLQN